MCSNIILYIIILTAPTDLIFPPGFRYGTATNTSDAAQRAYGPNAVQPVLQPQEVQRLCKEFKNDLYLSEEHISQIEQDTREQSNDNTGQWQYLRRYRLTASNFGLICKTQDHSSCKCSQIFVVQISFIKCVFITPGKGERELGQEVI